VRTASIVATPPRQRGQMSRSYGMRRETDLPSPAIVT